MQEARESRFLLASGDLVLFSHLLIFSVHSNAPLVKVLVLRLPQEVAHALW